MDKKDQRDAAIKDMYKKLTSIKEYGVQKYTSIWCINKVAEKFYLSAVRVQRIISSN